MATGAALISLILTFGPISGAHLNPAVTLADAIEHNIGWLEALAYIAVQCAGAVGGAMTAHLMFGLRWYSLSAHARQGCPLVLSEFVATFGLLSVICGCSRARGPQQYLSPLLATSPPPIGSPRLPRSMGRQILKKSSVSWSKTAGKWRASITINKKEVHIQEERGSHRDIS
jgi:hypothetical protein